MNQQEIGRFILQMRKEKEMTQKQLAEKIGVSDKAVSRWETGKGLPDTSIMPQLCSVLDININELLSGERLSDGTYNGKAEENMVYLMKVSEDKKKNERFAILGTILGMMVIVFIVLCMIFFSGGMSMIVNFIDLPSLIAILVAGAVMLAVGGQMKPFIYSFKYALSVQMDADMESKKQEMQKSYYAVKYAMKVFPVVGGIVFLISMIAFMGALDSDISKIGPILATAVISLFYALLLDVFLSPISGLLHNKVL